MKKIMELLGLSIEKWEDKSIVKKTIIVADWVIVVWFGVWLMYIAYPSKWDNTSIGNITLSLKDTQYKPHYIQELASSIQMLKKHNMTLVESTTIKLYRTKAQMAFAMIPGVQPYILLFAPEGAMFGHTVFAYERRQQKHNGLHASLAHELTHVWQIENYGYSKTLFWGGIPLWVKEGYAVFVAQQYSQILSMISKYYSDITDIKIFLRFYLAKNSELFSHSPADYLTYGLMVKHAIEDMHISVDDLHRGKVEYKTVLGSLLEKYGIEHNTSK